MKEATYALADLVRKTNYDDIPKDVLHEAKRRIADIIGIGLSGATTEIGKQIIKKEQLALLLVTLASEMAREKVEFTGTPDTLLEKLSVI